MKSTATALRTGTTKTNPSMGITAAIRTESRRRTGIRISMRAKATRETDEQSLPWPGCDSVASAKTLEEKARYFDLVARDRHIADDGLFRNLELDENLENVERWYHTENTILWSGIYLASQALRYAVTRDPETVENAKRILLGLLDLTRVTGVSGLYGRCLAKPGVPYPPVAEDHSGLDGQPGGRLRRLGASVTT